MLTIQDKSYFFDFLAYFESVKGEASKFHFEDTNMQLFLQTNRIFVGTFSRSEEMRRKKLGYQRFIKMTHVSAYDILRHIRNAIAHGHMEYKSRNVITLCDYSIQGHNMTMKTTIRRDLLISLIEEIKQTYK